jgi:hypothetical protein
VRNQEMQDAKDFTDIPLTLAQQKDRKCTRVRQSRSAVRAQHPSIGVLVRVALLAGTESLPGRAPVAALTSNTAAYRRDGFGLYLEPARIRGLLYH